MSTSPPFGPAGGLNLDLAEVHAALIATVQELQGALGRARTSQEANAVLDEISEVNARVTAVGRQLFTRRTQELAEASERVLAASVETRAAIGEIDDAVALIRSVTRFLALVDDVIDAAKLIM